MDASCWIFWAYSSASASSSAAQRPSRQPTVAHGRTLTQPPTAPAGTPDEERTPLTAGVWRYHPVRHEFEMFARGTSNPWGVDFNDHGQAFVTACVIPHLFHIIQGARYHRQGGQHYNPYVYDDINGVQSVDGGNVVLDFVDPDGTGYADAQECEPLPEAVGREYPGERNSLV